MSKRTTKRPASKGSARRDQEGVERFIAQFAACGVEAGMPPMPSRVFAALLISDTGRLSAAEIAETLQVSPAAVSGAVRYLVQTHLITREREVGSRRDTYVLPPGFWYEAISTRSPLLDNWAKAFEVGAAAVGPDSPAHDRLEESRDFFEFVQEEMPRALERWRKNRKPR